MSPRLILALLTCLGTLSAASQTVVVVRGVPLSARGSIDAADFDGDGDNDLMVIGQKLDGSAVTGLYSFNARLIEPIPRQAPRIVADFSRFSFPSRRMKSGDVAWGDIDGDGDSDLVVTGLAVDDIDINRVVESPATDLFENDGQTLVIRSTPNLPVLMESVAAWADIDGDGDLDLALSGLDVNGDEFLGVFVHDGSFSFQAMARDWPSLNATDMAWGDYDGDGDADLLVTGMTATGPLNTLLRNQGGSMTGEDALLPDRLFSSVSAGDYDGDGRDDVVLTGGVLGPNLVTARSDVYRSVGGTFEPLEADLGAVFAGTADWGDYDGDGDLDILLAGIQDVDSRENQRVLVYEQMDGAFRQAYSLRGVLFGPVIWYDASGNGRLDILFSGIQENALVMNIFEL